MFYEKKFYFSPFAGFLLLFVLLVGPQTVFAASTPSAETRFAESYATALRAIDAGRLNPSSAKEVHSINSAVQKRLLGLDTKQKQLKSDSVTADGADLDKILDQLVGLGAERERMFASYQQQLAQFTDVQRAVEETRVSAAQEQKAASVQVPPQQPEARSSKHYLQIESVPEDVTKGLFE